MLLVAHSYTQVGSKNVAPVLSLVPPRDRQWEPQVDVGAVSNPTAEYPVPRLLGASTICKPSPYECLPSLPRRLGGSKHKIPNSGVYYTYGACYRTRRCINHSRRLNSYQQHGLIYLIIATISEVIKLPWSSPMPVGRAIQFSKRHGQE